VVSTVVFSAGLVSFSFSRALWLSVATLAVTGCGMMVIMAGANTVIQTIVDEEKRGRVMSFYTMSFLGTAPFGSLFAGALSSRIGAPYTVLVSGLLCLGAASWFSYELPAIRAVVRPIYIKMGILPEVATGLQTAASLLTPPEQE
jgi:MFS family permease